MKRKTLPHGKKESAEMQTGINPESGLPAPDKKTRPNSTPKDKRQKDKIDKFRKKIEEGYYNGTDIIDKIVNKLLKDISD